MNRAWNEITAATIAGAARTNVPTFLAHYPSVAACGAAALDEAAADCRSVCRSALPHGRAACADLFLQASDAVLRWIAQRPQRARVLFVVPDQSCDATLLARLSAFKQTIATLFSQPARCSPAGRTHVEFVVGLFVQSVTSELSDGTSPAALRGQVLALLPFVQTTQDT